MKSKIKKIMLGILALATTIIGSGAMAAADSAKTGAIEGYAAMYVQNPEICVNGEKLPLDPVPCLKNGAAYIPLRPVAEALGGSIEWDAEKNSATVKIQNGKSVEISANSDVSELIGGRMYVNAGSLAEIFGKKYFYERGLIVIADEKLTNAG